MQTILLFVAQLALEILQGDLNRQDRAPGRIETGLDGFQARDRRVRRRGGAVRFKIVCCVAERLLDVGQGRSLLLGRLNRFVNLLA